MHRPCRVIVVVPEVRLEWPLAGGEVEEGLVGDGGVGRADAMSEEASQLRAHRFLKS